MTLPRNLLTAAQEHLDQLISDRTREGSHIDFKRDLPSQWNESSKHEFLADATAFANSGGGDLIFGIEEDGQAQASALVPQSVANIDQEVRRMQDFLLNLSEPRLPGVQVHPIQVTVGTNAGHAIVVRIPQSWAGPHRVKTNQHFYIREGLRKRQLDVPEIRSLFVRTNSQSQGIRDFRTERLGKILAGESPQKLVDAPILVVHLVPTQSALGLVQIDPIPYTEQRGLPIIGSTTTTRARLNIDGALSVRNETQHGYSQFFRNGFFESTFALTSRLDQGLMNLPSRVYEQYLINLLGGFRGELARLEINTECAVMISLLRANEVKLGFQSYDFIEPHQGLFDRKTLIFPDVLIQAEVRPEQGLKQAFDLVWQAAGFDGSRNYNAAGEWVVR